MGMRLPRIDLQPLAWALAAIVLSLGGGLLIGRSARFGFDVAIVLIVAVLAAARPYAVLLGVVLIIASLPGKEVIPFLVVSAGALALAMCARTIPGRRVSIPLLLLLLLAVPSLSLLPSPDEGIVAPELHLPVIGFPYASTPSVELHDWLTLGSVLVVFCLAAWSVHTQRQLARLAKTVLLSSLVPIVIGLGQFASGRTYERVGTNLKSVSGPFPHPNYFAFYLVIVLGVAVVALMESRRLYERLGLVALIAAGTTSLFLTYTRSAWIGFMITLLVMGFLRYRKLLVIAVVGIALAGFAAPSVAREAQQRFGDLTSKSEAASQNSWTWRVNQWSAMIPYGSDRPLTGQGWDSYTRLTVRRYGHFDKRYPTVLYPAYGVYSAVGFSAHNDYVKDFVELGVPGVALLVLTLVGLVSTAWRARRVDGVAPLATMMVGCAIALMVISAVDNLQGYTVALTYAFALCGALAGVTAGTRRTEAAHAMPPASPVADASGEEEVALTKAPADADRAADESQSARAPVRATGMRARLRGLLGRRRRST